MIDNSNYFDPDIQMEYMGASQFKSFLDCPARTIAELKGEFERPTNKALAMGSYVDAWFSDEMPQFIEQHPEMFKRDGTMKAEFLQCDKAIYAAEKRELFKEFMNGEHQVVMTGELYGSKYKIKMDSYFPKDKIVDLKYMKDMEPIYKDGTWTTFVDAWQYNIQLYIYQQIEAQNSKDGRLLPCYLAVITKEEEPRVQVIEIPQWKLNGAEALIKHYTPLFQAYKDGTKEPPRCGKCAYCHKTEKLERVMTYEELLEGIEK